MTCPDAQIYSLTIVGYFLMFEDVTKCRVFLLEFSANCVMALGPGLKYQPALERCFTRQAGFELNCKYYTSAE